MLDTQTETWSLINNTTTPGVFPTGISEFSGSSIAYDAGNELIFMGVRDPTNQFTGVVAFRWPGKLSKPSIDALYSGGVWNFGAPAPLVKGHLYDPHSQASLLSRYLKKGKKSLCVGAIKSMAWIIGRKGPACMC